MKSQTALTFACFLPIKIISSRDEGHEINASLDGYIFSSSNISEFPFCVMSSQQD